MIHSFVAAPHYRPTPPTTEDGQPNVHVHVWAMIPHTYCSLLYTHTPFRRTLTNTTDRLTDSNELARPAYGHVTKVAILAKTCNQQVHFMSKKGFLVPYVQVCQNCSVCSSHRAVAKIVSLPRGCIVVCAIRQRYLRFGYAIGCDSNQPHNKTCSSTSNIYTNFNSNAIDSSRRSRVFQYSSLLCISDNNEQKLS